MNVTRALAVIPAKTRAPYSSVARVPVLQRCCTYFEVLARSRFAGRLLDGDDGTRSACAASAATRSTLLAHRLRAPRCP